MDDSLDEDDFASVSSDDSCEEDMLVEDAEAQGVQKEKKYIVFRSCLHELFSMIRCACVINALIIMVY
jgi:hypothetical protein